MEMRVLPTSRKMVSMRSYGIRTASSG